MAGFKVLVPVGSTVKDSLLTEIFIPSSISSGEAERTCTKYIYINVHAQFGSVL